MPKTNRIERTTVARPPPPPPPGAPWWQARWVRQLALVVGAAALTASCPLWPAAVQPVCRAVAGAISGTVFDFSSPGRDGGS